MSQGRKLRSYMLKVMEQQDVSVGGNPDIVGISAPSGYPPSLMVVVDEDGADKVTIFMVKDGQDMPDVRCDLMTLGVHYFGSSKFGVFTPAISVAELFAKDEELPVPPPAKKPGRRRRTGGK